MCFGDVGGDEGNGGRDDSWLPPMSPPKLDRSTPMGLVFGPKDSGGLSVLRLMESSVGLLGCRGAMILVCVEAEMAPCMGCRSRQPWPRLARGLVDTDKGNVTGA